MKSSSRNVLIIGGSGGLGLELARMFLEEGDQVAIHFFRAGEKVLSFLRTHGYGEQSGVAFGCHGDIRSDRSTERLFRNVRQRWSRLDLLINSAGITADSLLLKMREESWNEILKVNLSGLFYCMKQAGLWMIPAGKGHIINIASRAGVTGRVGQANYASAKAGVIGLTKSAALEWGPDQVRVNAVLPGFLPTLMGLKASPRVRRENLRENSLGRPSTLTEVSRFIHDLSRMENVSGQVFNLDSRIVP